MNKGNKKNKRLCETLKLLNGVKVGQDVEKDKHVKAKTKLKKNSQNTFSMIHFYQSIPSNSIKLFMNLVFVNEN